jgi:hypothetical protein
MNGPWPSPPAPRLAELAGHVPELKDIKGQETAMRALEVAAAGGHNLLMLCNIKSVPLLRQIGRGILGTAHRLRPYAGVGSTAAWCRCMKSRRSIECS